MQTFREWCPDHCVNDGSWQLLAIVMTVGGAPLQAHLRAALRSGDFTVEDIEELD